MGGGYVEGFMSRLINGLRPFNSESAHVEVVVLYSVWLRF